MRRILRWILTRLQGGVRPDGFTAFGRTVWFVDPATVSPGLRAHEALHVEQQRRDGWRYYPRYLWQHIRRGYRGNCYELEAYAEQERVNEEVRAREGAPR